MEALLTKNIFLWPPAWRMIIVIAKSRKFLIFPKFGFYENKGKTYFVMAFGRIYMGIRICC